MSAGFTTENGQRLLSGFNRGFVHSVELEKFSLTLGNFLFHLTIPQVSSQVG